MIIWDVVLLLTRLLSLIIVIYAITYISDKIYLSMKQTDELKTILFHYLDEIKKQNTTTTTTTKPLQESDYLDRGGKTTEQGE
jgi:hypothetical protein